MTTNSAIRRQRKNYSLPSEALPVLNRMVGARITKFKSGTRYTSIDDILKEKAQYKEWNLPDGFHGQPYFLVFDNRETVVLYYDEFLGSIVLRAIERDVDEDLFFETLENQDQMGFRTSIKSAIDLPGESNFSGKIINSLSIYKLPTNFYVKPTAYDLINECVICMEVSDIGDVLFVCEVATKENPGGKMENIRLANWENLDHTAVAELSCIWSSSSVT